VKRSELVQLIDEIAEGQRRKVYQSALRLVPHLTEDDVLQPNDFPELEAHPEFRYEEGVLEGVLTVRMALLSCNETQ
jgi:hypothetical protein